MVMPVAQPVTTVEELLSLPGDGLRHELLEGQHVVTPVPRPDHERVVAELFVRVREATAQRSDVEVFAGKAEIRLGPKTLVQPDLLMLANPEGKRIREWIEAPIPLLAVEVVSPSTAAHDRGKKRRLYLEAGVEEYWVVDLDARLVERWRKNDDRPEIVDGRLVWTVGDGVSGTIDLPDLFERVLR